MTRKLPLVQVAMAGIKKSRKQEENPEAEKYSKKTPVEKVAGGINRFKREEDPEVGFEARNQKQDGGVRK